jgi:hypothetical protein
MHILIYLVINERDKHGEISGLVGADNYFIFIKNPISYSGSHKAGNSSAELNLKIVTLVVTSNKLFLSRETLSNFRKVMKLYSKINEDKLRIKGVFPVLSTVFSQNEFQA